MLAELLVSNQATTTVSSGGTTAPAQGTVETWTVASSAAFGAAVTGESQFHVADTATGKTSEIIAVTNVASTTWTVTRGAESTTPVAHSAGFTIQQVITAGWLSGLATALVPTAVKTSGYTASPNDFVPCDTTSAGFTVTLPNAPADGSVVGIKQVIQGGANTVTVACAGSDVFNKTGGSTSGTLTLLNQGLLLQYKASGAIWYVLGDDLPLSQLDGRYVRTNAAGSTANPMIFIAAPSGDTSGATDTAAIQAAENAATTAGAILVFAPGTYWVTGLTKQSNTTWQGAGRQVTTIKLAAASNKDVVQGANFATLTGTGSFGGITAWSIRDLTIDGNRSAQTGASWGLRVYGYDFGIENVSITNCHDDGMWTEWGYLGTVTYGGSVPDSMESRYAGVKCCFNGGWGWHNRGPHDSVAVDCIWFDNNQAGGTAGNLWCEDDNATQHYLAGGLQCIGCHSWGSSANWGIIDDSFLIWAGGEIEGGTFGAMLVRGGLDMSATRAYYLTPGTGTTGAGIQLGDDGSTSGAPSSFAFTSSEVRVSATGLDNFAGAGRSSAALAWVSCNKSAVDVHCNMPSAAVAVASNGQPVNALTGGQLFVNTTAGYPGTGAIYVATSGGYAKCAYTSVTGGGSPSFNGVTYVSGPGGNVATGGTVAGDPLGGTTPDQYSTVRVDQGSSGNSGIRGTLSVQQAPGQVSILAGYSAAAWRVQGATSNDLLNLNTATPSSPELDVVGVLLKGWKASYAGVTSNWNAATGGMQPGTTAGAGGTIYSGSGAPNVSGSVAGDLYIRIDTPAVANQRLYMATAGNTWTGIL